MQKSQVKQAGVVAKNNQGQVVVVAGEAHLDLKEDHVVSVGNEADDPSVSMSTSTTAAAAATTTTGGGVHPAGVMGDQGGAGERKDAAKREDEKQQSGRRQDMDDSSEEGDFSESDEDEADYKTGGYHRVRAGGE